MVTLNLLLHSLTKKETSLITLTPIWKMSLLEIGSTFLDDLGVQSDNGMFNFTERDVIGKPINIELERKYNDYTDKWNTSLKRVWKFDGTPVFEKYEIKDNQKNNNNNEQQTSKSSLNSPNNPFANANGPIDIDDKDLPF